MDSRTHSRAKCKISLTRSFSFCRALRYLSIASDVSGEYAPSVIRSLGRGYLSCDCFHGQVFNHCLTAAKSSAVNALSKQDLAAMICCPMGRSSIPSTSMPVALAANRVVPLPAKGSKTLPETIPYLESRYSTRGAENASLYLYQRYEAIVLFA